jgi:hypothetical protein
MPTKIKWKHLNRICTKMCQREINITLTDHKFYQDYATVSAVVFNQDKADILLNMNKVKDIFMTIKSIAHEVAHILLGNSKHGKKFQKKWEETERAVTQGYYNEQQ